MGRCAQQAFYVEGVKCTAGTVVYEDPVTGRPRTVVPGRAHSPAEISVHELPDGARLTLRVTHRRLVSASVADALTAAAPTLTFRTATAWGRAGQRALDLPALAARMASPAAFAAVLHDLAGHLGGFAPGAPWARSVARAWVAHWEHLPSPTRTLAERLARVAVHLEPAERLALLGRLVERAAAAAARPGGPWLRQPPAERSFAAAFAAVPTLTVGVDPDAAAPVLWALIEQACATGEALTAAHNLLRALDLIDAAQPLLAVEPVRAAVLARLDALAGLELADAVGVWATWFQGVSIARPRVLPRPGPLLTEAHWDRLFDQICAALPDGSAAGPPSLPAGPAAVTTARRRTLQRVLATCLPGQLAELTPSHRAAVLTRLAGRRAGRLLLADGFDGLALQLSPAEAAGAAEAVLVELAAAADPAVPFPLADDGTSLRYLVGALPPARRPVAFAAFAAACAPTHPDRVRTLVDGLYALRRTVEPPLLAAEVRAIVAVCADGAVTGPHRPRYESVLSQLAHDLLTRREPLFEEPAVALELLEAMLTLPSAAVSSTVALELAELPDGYTPAQLAPFVRHLVEADVALGALPEFRGTLAALVRAAPALGPLGPYCARLAATPDWWKRRELAEYLPALAPHLSHRELEVCLARALHDEEPRVRERAASVAPALFADVYIREARTTARGPASGDAPGDGA